MLSGVLSSLASLSRLLQGFVYLKFDSPAGAAAAKQVLHGRFYNGHRIEAEFQFLQTYNSYFGQQ